MAARNSDNAELLAHPDVTKIIGGMLGRFLPRQDVPDAVGWVQVKVLQWQRYKPDKFWPKNLDDYKRVSAKATRWYLIRLFKKARQRGDMDAGTIVENEDAHAAPELDPRALDQIDVKRGMKLFLEEVEKSKDPAQLAEIFAMLLEGEDQADIARKLGLKHQQVRDRVRKIREESREAWGRALGIAGAGAFFSVAFLAFNMYRWQTFSSHVSDRSVASVTRTVDQQAFVEMQPLQQAGEIRDRAREQCQGQAWSECLALLDLAAERDPEGDKTKEIQFARDYATSRANDALRNMDAKPGGR